MAQNGYSAGSLDFIVQSSSKDAINTLDSIIARYKTLLSLAGSTSSISRKVGSTTGRNSGGRVNFNFGLYNKQIKASTFSLTKMINKVYFLRNYMQQTFRNMVGIVEKAIDYTETLNLWQVAMRGNTREAEDFVQTMNKAYGIATQTLMQYQAIFRNMLSSLGGLSDNVSYQLSEYLTQMAIDYASLYNVSIERAMTTFQSVLSGQVRPIRSIAGYDITETTIFQLYQQLGGTKTMRQLSQTEKRLLRIYAVFQQMESSGAIGDLGKTMQSTANQWRMFTESAKELGTWLGIVFEPLIRDFLPKLNAFVITLTNIVKAFAKMQGIKPQEFGAVESIKELNEELEKTQGKLLSFDRFESLNSSAGGDNLLGIDESLLNGLSQYESILSKITGEAQDLAEKWSAWWVDDEGKLTENAQNLLDVLKLIGITLSGLIAMSLITKIGKLIKTIFTLKSGMGLLNLGIGVFVAGFVTFLSHLKDLSPIESATTLIIGLTVAITAAAVAFHAFKGNWVKAIGVGGIVGGAALGVLSTLASIDKRSQQFKTGGLVEDGLFQMSRGEIVGEFDDGTTRVANNQQITAGIENASYRGITRGLREINFGGGNVYIDKKKVGQIIAKPSHKEMVRTGLVKVSS